LQEDYAPVEIKNYRATGQFSTIPQPCPTCQVFRARRVPWGQPEATTRKSTQSPSQ